MSEGKEISRVVFRQLGQLIGEEPCDMALRDHVECAARSSGYRTLANWIEEGGDYFDLLAKVKEYDDYDDFRHEEDD